MAKSKNSNKGMIFGTVLGAVAGAAYAMWKTPMSGKELRSKLGAGPVNSTTVPAADQPVTTTTSTGGGMTDKVMSAVEHTLAPIVGVTLGKTANNGGSGNASATATTASTDIASPNEVQSAADGAPIADAAKGEAAMTTGEDTIRMKKFAWGTPAPDAEKHEVPIQSEETAPVEPVEDATSVPAAQTVGATSSTSGSGDTWNATSIRSQRFAWGDPKPESPEVIKETPVTDTNPAPEQRESNPSAPVPKDAGTANDTNSGTTAGQSTSASAPPVAESAGGSNVDDTIVASAASVSTGKMVPFPKLGGLENNK